MEKTGDTGMPKELASAANLMAHPLGGMAALSALGVGLASQTFGAWMGALTGMAEVSQRLFQPVDVEAPTAPAKKATAPARAAQPQAPAEKPAALMPEDFRRPKAMERPAAPDDLKAISGVGPKLEQVLNGFGVWTYAQIAGWSAEEIAWVEDYLGFKGRIGRDDWLAQAAALAGAETKR